MNCLKVNPELLIKRIDVKLRGAEYTFLNILNEYNILSNIYYEYLCGIDEYKLKNVWNHVISRWNTMKLALKSNSEFKNSEYSSDEYHQIHYNMNDETLNSLFEDFINDSPVRCLFVANCIQNYIYPK
jgi:hypothetical protein